VSKMIYKIIGTILAACVALFSFTPLAIGASEATSLDSLRVSFWPEYDHKDPQKSVLVIYRGRLPEETGQPVELKFPIPKGSDILAATSVDPSGRLMTKSYKVQPAGDLDELVYEVDSPEFQFEFYNFSTGTSKERNYNFPIRVPLAVKTLNVEIQKPLEATRFSIDPPSSNITSRKEQSNKSFDYYNYVVKDISPNASINFDVSYNKPDTRPSVDIQLGATSNFTDLRGERPWLLISTISALIVFAVTIFFVARRFKSPSRVRFGKGFKVSDHVKKRDEVPSGFCIQCGHPLKEGESYCQACGADV